MKIVANYSIKGGVGKTAAAVNLSYQFSLEGKKVLLIDLDPQGASGYYFKIKPKKKFHTEALIRKKESLLPFIRESDYEGLDVLPSNMGYRRLDISLGDAKKNKEVIKNSLKELKGEYDFIILDCPPNITLLSENVFNAAQTLVVPVIPSPLSERSYEQLLAFLGKHNFRAHNIIPFFSMVEKRKKVHRETMEQMRVAHPQFLDAVVPRSADVERMGVYREPVQCFASKRVGGAAFIDLGREILSRL